MAEEFLADIIAANEADTEKTTEVMQDLADAAKKQDDNIPEGSEATPAESQDEINKETEGVVENEDVTATDQDVEVSPAIEKLAEKLGWRKDHKGDDAVDAATYILRSREIQDTMREHNKDLKNQLSTIQGAVEALKQHNEKVYRADVKRMQAEIEELRKQKRAAVELADVEKVDELDQKIEDIQSDIKEEEEKSKEPTDFVNPIYDEWIKDNEWYLTDNEMAAYADTVAQQYQGAPLDRIYKLVRQKVAEVWPEKFVNEVPEEKPVSKVAAKPVPKAAPNPVEAGKQRGSSNTFTVADLTPEQQTIMKQFVASGIMTEEQYVKDIAKLQEG